MKEKRSRAYAYARVSSETQAEKGTSIPSQLDLMKRYARQNNVTIKKEFVDEAESATTDNRPQFQEMIALCIDNVGEVDAILVWKLSRFARNRVDSVVYKKLLSKQGIRVISISEPIEDTPEGRILEGMIELMDGYSSEILSKEVLRGMRQAAKQGYHTGGKPPYGYRLRALTVGNAVKKVWEIEPKEAEAVKLIYNMHREGYMYKDIIRKLEEIDYKPRFRKKWGKSSISDILRKHCYSGTNYFNTRRTKDLGRRVLLQNLKDRSEWIPIKVPQIVDEETFNAVKERMKKRQFKSPRRSTTQILSGLLVCGICEQPYVIGDYYRGKYPYYRCSTKMKLGKEACENRYLRGDEIDEVIMNEVQDVVFSEVNLQKYRQLIQESFEDEKKEHQSLLDRLEREQRELERKKALYYEAIEKGEISFDLVAERLGEIKDEEEKNAKIQQEAEERILSLPEAADYSLSKKEYTGLKKDLASLIKEATPQQKRQFLSQFILSITVHPEKLVVEYVPPMVSKKKPPGRCSP